MEQDCGENERSWVVDPNPRLVVAPGVSIRYRQYGVAEPRCSVILVQGRAEFIEKYEEEVIPELVDRGCEVFALDLRGQGLSTRPLRENRQKGHAESFEDYVDDLEKFVERVVRVRAACPDRMLLMAHSLGGHISLRFLLRRPEWIWRAVLLTPLVRFPASAVSGTVWRGLELLKLLGRGTVYAAMGDWDPHRRFVGNALTSDPRRYRFKDRWIAHAPILAQGGPTVSWLLACRRSLAALQHSDLEAISCPTLGFIAGADRVVDNAAIASLFARLPRGELVTIPESEHEILYERDVFRIVFWEHFDRFLASAPDDPAQ